MARRRRGKSRGDRKKKKNKRKGAAGAPRPETVERLLEGGRHQEALREALALHGQERSERSESLLGRAYLERLRGLSATMGAEAEALAATAAQRCPSIRPALDALQPQLDARFGRFDRLLRPLDDPALPSEQRLALEGAIRREATDLAGLASCEALAASHPLRAAAAALARVFVRVTSGPVEDSELALPEVSRRSPLAPWKLLIRAIAELHRGNDAACAATAERVDPESAPARAVPALLALLDPAVTGSGRDASSLGARARQLIRKVAADDLALRSALAELDRAFEQKVSPNQLLRRIRAAVLACQQARPDLLEALRQRISVRWMRAELPVAPLRQALGGPTRHDAAFWRLMARALEQSGPNMDTLKACACWEEFRRHGLRQGWLDDDGPELAGLYLHMADLLGRLPREHLPALRRQFFRGFSGFQDAYHGQPEDVMAAAPTPAPGEPYFVDPEALFERAGRADPDGEVFGRWLRWARASGQAKAADRCAEAWRRALPRDPRPLFHLARSAEQRNALKKALTLLEAAERLDGPGPEVGRARLRLLVATALRHLRDHRPHLLDRDLSQLEQLPALQGDQQVILPALRWARAAQAGEGGDTWNEEVERALEGKTAARLLLATVARAARVPAPTDALPDAPQRAWNAGRACAAAANLGLSPHLPPGWAAPLTEDLLAGLDENDRQGQRQLSWLTALGEAALSGGHDRLAHAAAGTGLSCCPPAGARAAACLLLRARSLPRFALRRRVRCLEAVASVAERYHDDELRTGVAEAGQGLVRLDHTMTMSDEEIAAVVAEEQSAAYPERPDPDDFEQCQCHECRRRRAREQHAGRGGAADDDAIDLDFLLDDDDDDDDDELDEELDIDFDDPANRSAANELLQMLAELGQLQSFLRQQGLPAKVAKLFTRAVERHGVLDPEEVRVLDPPLYREIEQAMGRFDALPFGRR